MSNAQPEPTKFPSPIGGLPVPHDLPASILFAVLYALAVPLAIYRLASRRSRTIFILGTTIFTIQRVVDFSFRAAEAETPSLRTTKFWVNWLQSVYAMGFIGIAGDVSNLARVFLLKTTHGSDPAAPHATFGLESPCTSAYGDGALTPKPDNDMSSTTLTGAKNVCVEDVLVDEPQRRVWINRFGLLTLVMRFTALGLGGVYAGVYFSGITDHSLATLSQQMRYASTIIMVVYLPLPIGMLLWARIARPTRVALRPVLFLITICLLLFIPVIYRLAAMANYTTSLLSVAPGSLNSPAAKAVFYVLHIVPEWISGMMLLVVNVRDLFGISGSLTGM